MFEIVKEEGNIIIKSNDDRYIYIKLLAKNIAQFHKWLSEQKASIVFTKDSNITETFSALSQLDIAELIIAIETGCNIKPDRFITKIKESLSTNKKIKLKKVLNIANRDVCKEDILKKISSLSNYQVRDIYKSLTNK